jgi:hypothetical protein
VRWFALGLGLGVFAALAGVAAVPLALLGVALIVWGQLTRDRTSR